MAARHAWLRCVECGAEEALGSRELLRRSLQHLGILAGPPPPNPAPEFYGRVI
jgi:hypothetical protein